MSAGLPRRTPARVHRSRIGAGLALCLLLAPFCGTVPAVATPSAAPVAGSTAETPAETSASNEAQESGQPVPVASETTETSTVIANPDGTFTLHASTVAVRARQADGTWAPIDTTLQASSRTGRLAPANTALDMTFSAGGDGPLVTLDGAGADADKQVSLTWPTTLPAPTLAGDTATYHDVYPGVDLQMIAQADAFNEVLVVHDAAAAANPALENVQLAVTGTGVSVTADPTDGLIATDPETGQIVFQSSPAIAWDSSAHSQVGTGISADDTGGATITRLDVSTSEPTTTTGPGAVVTEIEVSVAVPRSTLTGPDVTYPVYIDPPMTGTGHYAVVLSNGAPYYDDSTQHPKVGYCGYAGCNGIGTARAYFSIGTSTLANRATTAHIYDADFNITQIHNGAGCTATPVDLYQSGAFSPSITWGGPITTFLEEVSAGNSDTCSTSQPNRIHFDGTAVRSYIQSGATADRTTTYFALRAPNESTASYWKQFNDDAELDVNYDFPPSTPDSLAVSGALACSGKPIYSRDSTPTLAARSTDNNPSPGNVGLYYELYNDPSGGAAAVRYNPARVLDPSGTIVNWTTNSSNTNSTAALPDGPYAYRVYGYTGSPPQNSNYSPWYHFILDTSLPAVPTISSFDYPSGNWGAPQAAPGSFTLRSTGAAAFAYAFDSSSNLISPTATDCAYTSTTKRWVTATGGSASFTAPSLTPGPHTLYVKAFDDAHNVSGAAIPYSFYVAPTVANEGSTQFEAEVLANSSTTPMYQPPSQGIPVYVEGSSSSSLWSGGYDEHLVATAGTESAPQQFTFPFSAAVEADYALGVGVTSQYHFGVLAFEIDGQPVLSNGARVKFDAYATSGKAGYVSLGGQHLLPGSHTITVDVVGKNSASTDYVHNGTYGSTAFGGSQIMLNNFHDNGYSANIDFFNVVPINNVSTPCPAGATDISQCLQRSMNNNGVAVDGTTSANIGPSVPNVGLSRQALTAAGFGPGQTVTVDSATPAEATFTMPAYSAGAVDNTIADGQTIPLPSPVLASSVDLLVLSTCGSVSANAATLVTINYQDGAYTSKQLPSIGDWNAAALADTAPAANSGGRTLAATLPYRDVGTTKDTAHTATIYHVQVPVDYLDDAVTSVTLPSTGTNFTNDCTTPALHVLAMTSKMDPQ